MSKLLFSLSVVSHGHLSHVAHLLSDLASTGRNDFELILTLNLPEAYEDILVDLPFARSIIANPHPKGFAANHNAAFERSKGENFVILNPDIRISGDPFDGLIPILHMQPPAIVAPLIVNDLHEVEDSARCFPSPFSPVKRYLSRLAGVSSKNEIIPISQGIAYPDWVAGMFMVIPQDVYRKLRGMDERYYLYYEDVDFCARASLAGYEVRLASNVPVIHNAQRDSHRKLRFLMWHVQSAFRFFTSPVFFRITQKRYRRNA